MSLTVDFIRKHLKLVGEDVVRVSTGEVVLWGNNRSKVITVGDGKTLQYHRVKFALAHGLLPAEVDHRDRDRDNMLLSNLRPATHQQNMWNRIHRRKDGLPRGVYRAGRKFRAMVQIDGKLKHLGCFASPELAAARVEATLKPIHGEFYRGST